MMRTFAVLTALLFFGQLGCQLDSQSAPELGQKKAAIVNGNIENGFPGVGAMTLYVPSRRAYFGNFCSGALIAPGWVLTAAHCITGAQDQARMNRLQFQPSYISFFVGSNARTAAPNELFAATDVYIHPYYSEDREAALYDIALVRLGASPNVEHYPLFRGNIEDYLNYRVKYVGFGISDPQRMAGSGLKRSTSLELTGVLPTTYLSNQMNSGVCFGDSGGPGLISLNGQFQVIGVNSAVSGEAPTCLTRSIQTRVDAYLSWIDQIMGQGGGCGQNAEACQCPQACTGDGFCDNLNCGTGTCSELFGCMNDCQDETCVLLCAGETSREAYGQFGDLMECARRNCANGQFGCIRERCTDIYRACYGEGESDCAAINSCTNTCVNAQCRQSCVSEGTWQAQGQFANITDCIIERCGQFQNDFAALDECRNTQCRDAYTECMPPDNCSLLGGDCAPGKACIAETWGSTYCQQTEGLTIGQECFAGKITCADGSICRFMNGGTVCQENCFQDSDCTNQDARCEPYVGTPVEYGACVNPENCQDSDGDLACDDSDCAPNDPQARPGYAEKCGDDIDNNCDGEIDEGCEPVCEPVDEICGNQTDEDCDGKADEGCSDENMPCVGDNCASTDQPMMNNPNGTSSTPMSNNPSPDDLANGMGGAPVFFDPNDVLVDASADDDGGAGCACDANESPAPVSWALAVLLLSIGYRRRLF